jgi:hypothetical protein
MRQGKNNNLILTLSSKDKNSEVFSKIEIIVDKILEIKK